MTDDQAERLMADLLALFPDRDVPRPTQEEYLNAFRVLPEHVARRALGVGKATWTFWPRISEIGDALSLVSGEARRQFARAIETGAEFWPDLRSETGWRVVERGAPLPKGVAEAALLTDGALPPGRPVDDALPVHDGKAAVARGALPVGQALRLVDPRHGEPAARPLDEENLPALPPALRRVAVEARTALAQADELLEEARAARRVATEEALYYQQERERLLGVVLPADLPVELAADVAARVLRRVVAAEQQLATGPTCAPGESAQHGRRMAVEAFCRSVYPGLELAEWKEATERDDPLEEVGRVVAVRLVLRTKKR